MKLPLKGIIPPVVTPLLDDVTLDVEGLERLIDHIIEGGVHGLFILGSSGEGPSLPYSLQEDVIKRVCNQVKNRVPVLVGITDTSFTGLIKKAEYSKSVGADAVVVAPPYYYPVSEVEFLEYLENLSIRVPLPFLLYNIPSHTKLNISLHVVEKAKELGAIGIKDSSGDMSFFYTLVDRFRSDPEFSIITGTEMFIPEAVMFGGHGAIAGGANIFPQLYVDIYNAAVKKDVDTIIELREKVMGVHKNIYNVGQYNSRYVKSIKCSLSVMGICSDYMPLPHNKFRPFQKENIKEYIDSIMDLKGSSIL
ncbi:MAG: dihydrodipicolinate synthase family protein [Cyclobacteriaceae bacterium]|nr:dihydrodipicolinate synthase family protein [Cyclobacteriaceae bacterium]